MSDVARMSFGDRLGSVLGRTAEKVGPALAAQLRALIDPKSLAFMASTLIAWGLLHTVGVGEFIDAIIAGVGLFYLGTAIFSGLDELYEFFIGAYHAKTDADLGDSADHLAKAIAILGISAVLSVLFRGRPTTRRANLGPPPPRVPGFRYRPTTTGTSTIKAGGGVTSWWGDIEFSTLGSATDREIVLYHEQVHQLLSPKLYFMRNIRVEMRAGSYTGSSLFRYLEEVLAETVAQVRVSGPKEIFSSIRFPTRNGYVFWRRAGADPHFPGWSGHGVVPEGAALLATGSMLKIAVELWYKAGAPAPQPKSGQSTLPPATKITLHGIAR